MLGVWITQDAGDWTRNTKEICKSAYARKSMLTKIKYVGVGIEDLLEILSLFIRSRVEYCAVAFHSFFSKRCLRTEEMARIFPLNTELPNLQLRQREQFVVNFAHWEKCKLPENVERGCKYKQVKPAAASGRVEGVDGRAGGQAEAEEGGQAGEPGHRGGL